MYSLYPEGLNWKKKTYKKSTYCWILLFSSKNVQAQQTFSPFDVLVNFNHFLVIRAHRPHTSSRYLFIQISFVDFCSQWKTANNLGSLFFFFLLFLDIDTRGHFYIFGCVEIDCTDFRKPSVKAIYLFYLFIIIP